MSQGPTDALLAQSASGFGVAVMTNPSCSAIVNHFFRSASPSPLEIPELVENILSYLARKDIVSAARVCRAWSEPALDQIWHCIDSLAPLLRLVGPVRRSLGNGWEFTGAIQNADWSRYALYAPRIRVITVFSYYAVTGVSNQALQSIVDHIPSHLSLPRPSSIHVFMRSPTQAIPLISQSLRKLNVGEVRYLSGRSAYNCTVAVVAAAATLHAPCLESLGVVSSFSDATQLEAFNMCLAKHNSKISILKARLPFDSQTWDSIFGLPALRTLDMAPLNTSAPGPSEEIISMIRTLVAEQPLLKTLQLELPFPTEQTQDDSLYSQVIHELMGLRNLETLALYVIGPLSLSESDVRYMGTSWPKIRNLQFHPNISRSLGWPPNGITIQNDLTLLPSFLRYLPSLEELHIQFTCNPPLTAPQERLQAPAFRMLNVEVSPYPQASCEDVVAYLAAVLPDAAHVGYTGVPGPNNIGWPSIIERRDSGRGAVWPGRTWGVAPRRVL